MSEFNVYIGMGVGRTRIRFHAHRLESGSSSTSNVYGMFLFVSGDILVVKCIDRLHASGISLDIRRELIAFCD
jgi:hypothetical protein